MVSVNWAYFLLIAAALGVYAINRGVYVGSSLVQESPQGHGTGYQKHCRYLFPSGVVVRVGSYVNREYAENAPCRFFYD